MPWERLRFVKGAMYRFGHDDVGGKTAAERLRLGNLAHALALWNENTGALSQFDIDPLPHQIHLVHHILGPGNLNWPIADDVGTGTVIEAGLLVQDLRNRMATTRVTLLLPDSMLRSR